VYLYDLDFEFVKKKRWILKNVKQKTSAREMYEIKIIKLYNEI